MRDCPGLGSTTEQRGERERERGREQKKTCDGREGLKTSWDEMLDAISSRTARTTREPGGSLLIGHDAECVSLYVHCHIKYQECYRGNENCLEREREMYFVRS